MNRRQWMAVGGAMVLGFGLRAASFPHLMRDGVKVWYDPDSSYHVMRVQRSVEAFPRVPAFDPDSNAPVGFRCPWPPLFDFGLAAAAKLMGGGPEAVNAACTWAPAVLGALTVPAVAWLGFEVGGPVTAVWAAIAIATLPGHIYKTIAGRPDHHSAEALLSPLALACAVRAVGAGSTAWWVVAGLASVAALATWPGAVVLPILMSIGLALATWVRAGSGTARALVRGATIQGLVTLVVSIPLCALSPVGQAGGFSFEELSWFQVAALLLSLPLPWLGAEMRRRPRTVLLGCAIVVAGILLTPGFSRNLLGGTEYLTSGNPWMAANEENQPLLSHGGGFRLEKLTGFLGFGGLILPFLFYGWLRGHRQEERLWIIAPWLAGAAGLSLMQSRFINIGAVAAALLYGGGMAALAGRLSKSGRHVTPVLASLWLILWVPCAGALAQMDESVRNHTPPSGLVEAMADLTMREKGVVMASFWEGHWIEFHSGQRVVGSNFHINREGNMACARFFSAATADEADAVLQARHVRYILLDATARPDAALGAAMLGRPAPPAPFAASVYDGTRSPPHGWRLLPTPGNRHASGDAVRIFERLNRGL